MGYWLTQVNQKMAIKNKEEEFYGSL